MLFREEADTGRLVFFTVTCCFSDLGTIVLCCFTGSIFFYEAISSTGFGGDTFSCVLRWMLEWKWDELCVMMFSLLGLPVKVLVILSFLVVSWCVLAFPESNYSRVPFALAALEICWIFVTSWEKRDSFRRFTSPPSFFFVFFLSDG